MTNDEVDDERRGGELHSLIDFNAGLVLFLTTKRKTTQKLSGLGLMMMTIEQVSWA